MRFNRWDTEPHSMQSSYIVDIALHRIAGSLHRIAIHYIALHRPGVIVTSPTWCSTMVPIIAYMWLRNAIYPKLSNMVQQNDVNNCIHVAQDCYICNFGPNCPTPWCQQLYTCGSIAEGPGGTSQLDLTTKSQPQGPCPTYRDTSTRAQGPLQTK